MPPSPQLCTALRGLLRKAKILVTKGVLQASIEPAWRDGGERKGGGGAGLRRPLQLGTAAKASCPRYQQRAGLRFSRSYSPASTAGLFFDKQDASIRGCQHPSLSEKKRGSEGPTLEPRREGREVLFLDASQRSENPCRCSCWAPGECQEGWG